MQFDDDAQLDPSQVEDVRASGPQPGWGGMPGGCTLPIGGRGGCGGCLMLILAAAGLFLFGVIPSPFSGQGGGPQGGGLQPSAPATWPGAAPTGNLAARCRTGADAEQSEDCRVVGTVNSIQSYWRQAFQERGRTYRPARTVLFSNAVETGCGTADAAVGPFYCPVDRKVYLDLSFFNTLQRDFGAEGGPFAQAYVVAHEYGHHVQNLLGTMNRVGPDSRPGAGSPSVRLELQADCYAGVWAHNAVKTGFFRQPFSQTDIDQALSAASAVGDDSIQRRTQGRVTPDAFTHGTSRQRKSWFTVGYDSGDPKRCDTFSGGI
ncbi:neutral zinc metallopeptidase [Nonomuraea angiospora]|uniref:Metalloprotease n=1 Tax=Nonomuraea angiospora TaxID=46172 RepID=A0ABR9M8A5_9ACTN|nr:neutral zinc metallopeptidase [Nonomuraea angiospora]MBE1588820.1 putative metalloprotease [Nonomuraea angiospora]